MLTLLETPALDIAATRYLTLAATTLLIYDHALTIGDEVALVWPAKFGLLKAIYLFNRYIVAIWIVATFSIISGHATFLNDLLVAIQTTSFVVAARVFDIWGRPRAAFLTLSVIWLVHCVIDFVIVTENAVRQAPHFRHEPLFNLCFGDVTSSWTGWLNGIIYHALVLLLLTWIWGSTPRSTQTPFMKLVVRDGFIYFAVIFTAALFNLLIWRYGRATLAALPYWTVWAATTQALSRLLLSMGSVQTPSEWGQHATVVFPPIDVELGALRDREPKELNVVSTFCDDGSTTAGRGMRLSYIGKFQA
ncbi:hypothetical protein FRC06_005651 [Ceratobasidium sp. 370]|nr:hypothetical protein FRC06_005651 [Ceratobasidium sp. 370]